MTIKYSNIKTYFDTRQLHYGTDTTIYMSVVQAAARPICLRTTTLCIPVRANGKRTVDGRLDVPKLYTALHTVKCYFTASLQCCQIAQLSY